MSTSAPPRVLVTGASGTTGGLLVEQLAARVPVVATTRRPAAVARPTDSPHLDVVAFEWNDPATWDETLDHVDAAYLVPPTGVVDPEPVMRALVERAVAGGLRRVVLHGADSIEASTTGLGLLQTRLADLVPEWAVIRPSWFMQNLLGDHPQARSLRSDATLRTATGQGRIPFVDAADIAAVGRVALLGPALQRDVIVTGPEALTYDQVAAILTDVSGIAVRHENLTPVQALEVFPEYPPEFARLLVDLDVELSAGRWNATTAEVERLTGRPPRDLRSFLMAHRDELHVAGATAGTCA